MKLYVTILLFLSLFMTKSESAQWLTTQPIATSTQQEYSPACPICLEDFSRTSMVVPLTCTGKENHVVCVTCYKKLQDKQQDKKCPECMQAIAPMLHAKQLCKTKEYSNNHCAKCFSYYPHANKLSALCNSCTAQLAQIYIEPIHAMSNDTSSEAPKVAPQTEQINQGWLSKLKSISGEAGVACIVTLTARTLYNNGKLFHEKSSERNTAWSTIVGSFILGNRLLDTIQPDRKNTAKTLGVSWLLGGALGILLPELLKKNDHKNSN